MGLGRGMGRRLHPWAMRFVVWAPPPTPKGPQGAAPGAVVNRDGGGRKGEGVCVCVSSTNETPQGLAKVKLRGDRGPKRPNPQGKERHPPPLTTHAETSVPPGGHIHTLSPARASGRRPASGYFAGAGPRAPTSHATAALGQIHLPCPVPPKPLPWGRGRGRTGVFPPRPGVYIHAAPCPPPRRAAWGRLAEPRAPPRRPIRWEKKKKLPPGAFGRSERPTQDSLWTPPSPLHTHTHRCLPRSVLRGRTEGRTGKGKGSTGARASGRKAWSYGTRRSRPRGLLTPCLWATPPCRCHSCPRRRPCPCWS